MVAIFYFFFSSFFCHFVVVFRFLQFCDKEPILLRFNFFSLLLFFLQTEENNQFFDKFWMRKKKRKKRRKLNGNESCVRLVRKCFAITLNFEIFPIHWMRACMYFWWATSIWLNYVATEIIFRFSRNFPTFLPNDFDVVKPLRRTITRCECEVTK